VLHSTSPSAESIASSPNPASSSTEATGGAHASADDVAGLREMLWAHKQGLFAIAWAYLQDREEALDACQESLVKALRHIGRYDPDQPISAWLSRIVRNTCLDRLRRLKHRRHASLEDRNERGLPDPPSRTGDPEEAILRVELRRRLHSAMSALEPKDREVIVLRDVLDWPYARIESFLGLSHGTLASQIHRARAKLRAQLAGYVQAPAREGRR